MLQYRFNERIDLSGREFSDNLIENAITFPRKLNYSLKPFQLQVMKNK